MLQALLPQVAPLGKQVEVWVIVNGADEVTIKAVETAQELGPIKCIPKPIREDRFANFRSVISTVLSGEFVWLLGDHNLMAAGALQNVVSALEKQSHFDSIYVNFRCASYPDQWPDEAIGGYQGNYKYLGNADCEDRQVYRWEQLVRPESALCTQQYAHIFRRAILETHFSGRVLGEPYSSGETTFVHTFAIAAAMFGRPSYYIGSPSVTIFNGAQSWSSERAKVFLIGFPELLAMYEKLGLSDEQLRGAHEFVARHTREILVEVFRRGQPDQLALIPKYFVREWHRAGTMQAVWSAFVDSQCCWIAVALKNMGHYLESLRDYWFFNCRPARWVRAHLEKR
jgi:hypothetical protein